MHAFCAYVTISAFRSLCAILKNGHNHKMQCTDSSPNRFLSSSMPYGIACRYLTRNTARGAPMEEAGGQARCSPGGSGTREQRPSLCGRGRPGSRAGAGARRPPQPRAHPHAPRLGRPAANEITISYFSSSLLHEGNKLALRAHSRLARPRAAHGCYQISWLGPRSLVSVLEHGGGVLRGHPQR